MVNVMLHIVARNFMSVQIENTFLKLSIAMTTSNPYIYIYIYISFEINAIYVRVTGRKPRLFI